MKHIHVRNLDKYQDGYKDRRHYWAKIYLEMIQGNPESEMLNEIDFSRLVKLIVLESCTRNKIPASEAYLSRKGFDFKLRKLDETIKSLSHFIEVTDVTENNDSVTVSLPREEESREEKKERCKRAIFKKPTLEELKELFGGKGFPAEAERFFGHYEANGWRVGRNPMQSLQHAVANWIRNMETYGKAEAKPFVKKQSKPKTGCEGCGGTGKLPDGKKCWCWT